MKKRENEKKNEREKNEKRTDEDLSVWKPRDQYTQHSTPDLAGAPHPCTDIDIISDIFNFSPPCPQHQNRFNVNLSSIATSWRYARQWNQSPSPLGTQAVAYRESLPVAISSPSCINISVEMVSLSPGVNSQLPWSFRGFPLQWVSPRCTYICSCPLYFRSFVFSPQAILMLN